MCSGGVAVLWDVMLKLTLTLLLCRAIKQSDIRVKGNYKINQVFLIFSMKELLSE